MSEVMSLIKEAIRLLGESKWENYVHYHEVMDLKAKINNLLEKADSPSPTDSKQG